MKISKLIKKLEKIEAKSGDIDVLTQDPDPAFPPVAVEKLFVFQVGNEPAGASQPHLPFGTPYALIQN